MTELSFNSNNINKIIALSLKTQHLMHMKHAFKCFFTHINLPSFATNL